MQAFLLFFLSCAFFILSTSEFSKLSRPLIISRNLKTYFDRHENKFTLLDFTFLLDNSNKGVQRNEIDILFKIIITWLSIDLDDYFFLSYTALGQNQNSYVRKELGGRKKLPWNSQHQNPDFLPSCSTSRVKHLARYKTGSKQRRVEGWPQDHIFLS